MENYLVGTVIRDKILLKKNVTRRVPQESVLVPIMCLIYINNMLDGLNSYMNMFLDDAKIIRHIRSTMLQGTAR